MHEKFCNHTKNNGICSKSTLGAEKSANKAKKIQSDHKNIMNSSISSKYTEILTHMASQYTK